MAEIQNKPSVTGDETVNVNRNQVEHRATWMGLSYEAAREAGADAEKILREAVAKTGCLHGERIKKKLSMPVKLDEFAELFLSPVGISTFEMEFKTKDENTLEIRFHYCPLVNAWLRAGIPTEDIPLLCDIAMDGDRNIAGTVGVDFSLGKTIAAGDDICEVDFYRKK